MSIETKDESSINMQDITFLRKLRNEVVGSIENKLTAISNGLYEQILNCYLNLPEQTENLNLDQIQLFISIINSFIIGHSSIQSSPQITFSQLHYSLSGKTIKLISLFPIIPTNYSLFENLFRLLANLRQANLITVGQSFNSFISLIDKYLLNDILFQSICIILSKICECSYYNQLVISNEVLVDILINKFYSHTSIVLRKSLLRLLVELTEHETPFANSLYEKNINAFSEQLSNGIRYYDIEMKMLEIKLVTNILANGGPKATSILMKEPIVTWSISILVNLLQENSLSIINKTRCINALSNLLKKSIDFQDKFYNLEGIELLMKELRLLYNDNQLKEIDDKIKAFKVNKEKKSEKIFVLEKDDDEIISNDTVLDEKSEYIRAIIDCLASSSSLKEESRKKIIQGKDNQIINIILFILSDPCHQSKLLLASALLILSISRGHSSLKKTIIDYDITSLLFKLSSHSNVDVQIQVTNSLCNFLLESPNSTGEITECVNHLLKIFKTTKHKKIRFNSVCAMKNIFYSVNSSKEIKKSIMNKITYDTLLVLLDDEDLSIQEQALLIFRVLLYKTSDDIEEVFVNCKDKLLENIQEKLNNAKSIDIVIHSLYVLSNISTGNSKQKSAIDKNLILKIIDYGNSDNKSVKLVCTIILNNLLTSVDTQKIFVSEINLTPLLDKLAFENCEEDVEIKNNAMSMLSIIKNLKK